MSRLSVIVTGIGGGSHGEQILKALRLSRLTYRIIGTDLSPHSANRTKVDKFYVVPPASDPNYLDELLKVARQESAKALFHGSEQEMVVFSQHRQELENAGLFVPVNSSEVIQICQDKIRTFERLSSFGFRVPKWFSISSMKDTDNIDIFPIILKPSAGGGGSVNTFIVQDRNELQMISKFLLNIYSRFIAQEYVGHPEKEFTVGVLFGRDGVLLNSIAIRRIIESALSVRMKVPNRTRRADLGPMLVISSGVSQGEVGQWPNITQQCEAIAAALKPEAPINIQCRLVGDWVIPFEINPRFSGTTSIRAMVGYNEPDVLIRRDLLGEVIDDHFSYESAIVLRGLAESRS